MGNVAPQARCRLSYSGWLEIKLSMKEIECFKKVAFLAVGIDGHLHSTNITSCSILLSMPLHATDVEWGSILPFMPLHVEWCQIVGRVDLSRANHGEYPW